MRVVLFGASGMVGQGVLRECLERPEVEAILSIVRQPTGQTDPRLTEIVHQDFMDLAPLESRLAGYDACFYCLGISSAGVSERDYERVSYFYPITAARLLARLNPAMTFIYLSGAGADATERGRTMWARVKGRTENAILRLPFRRACIFRPGLIQPLNGIRSRTPLYRTLYTVLGPLLPTLRRSFPNHITTTSQVGCAMVEVALHGAPATVLENRDINALCPNPT